VLKSGASKLLVFPSVAGSEDGARLRGRSRCSDEKQGLPHRLSGPTRNDGAGGRPGEDSSYSAEKSLELGAVETGHRLAVDDDHWGGHIAQFF
jgi:hypothetical protein